MKNSVIVNYKSIINRHIDLRPARQVFGNDYYIDAYGCIINFTNDNFEADLFHLNKYPNRYGGVVKFGEELALVPINYDKFRFYNPNTKAVREIEIPDMDFIKEDEAGGCFISAARYDEKIVYCPFMYHKVAIYNTKADEIEYHALPDSYAKIISRNIERNMSRMCPSFHCYNGKAWFLFREPCSILELSLETGEFKVFDVSKHGKFLNIFGNEKDLWLTPWRDCNKVVSLNIDSLDKTTYKFDIAGFYGNDKNLNGIGFHNDFVYLMPSANDCFIKINKKTKDVVKFNINGYEPDTKINETLERGERFLPCYVFLGQLGHYWRIFSYEDFSTIVFDLETEEVTSKIATVYDINIFNTIAKEKLEDHYIKAKKYGTVFREGESVFNVYIPEANTSDLSGDNSTFGKKIYEYVKRKVGV